LRKTSLFAGSAIRFAVLTAEEMITSASVDVLVTFTAARSSLIKCLHVMTCVLTGGKHAAARFHAALAGSFRMA